MNPRVIRPRRPRPEPPVPPGLLGWNVYTGSGHLAEDFRFREFIPAPGLDARLEEMTDGLVAEIEAGEEP